MSDRPLRPDERQAWDSVRRSIRPLNAGKSPRVKRELTEHPILNRLGRSGPSAASAAATPQRHPHNTAPAPQDRSEEKLVRRGKIKISARFDLHGHTQESAWTSLPAFLVREQARGSHCVIVITGKGREGSGILRHNFLRWLDMPDARPLVSGFAKAHPRHGGAGAFYVFLRRR